MLKELSVTIAGILLLVLCCAGPLLFASAGASLALALARVHLPIIIAPLVLAALIAAILVFRARRSNAKDDLSGVMKR
jgi:hypothetical protein